jgi:hypothetical protein
MIHLLYSFGYMFFLYAALRLGRNCAGPDRLFLVVLAMVPLGKLVYFPVPWLMGFKFCFLFLCLALPFLAVRYCTAKVETTFLFPLLFLIPAAMSLAFLSDITMLFKYSIGGEQTDSVLARFVALAALAMFACWVARFVVRVPKGFRTIAVVYTDALLFATLVGYVITVLVFVGRLTVEDLLPISADTHLVDIVYRFNPGANVNEFGMLLGYGIMFVLWLDWPGWRKKLYLTLFILAEFLTLTRACWIGVSIGLIVYVLMVARNKVRNLVAIAAVLLVIVALISLDPDVSKIMISRTVMDIGASGAERLDKYALAYDEVMSSPWRLLFGFGWSTNLYIHSVPLQLLYETGLIGFLGYVLIGAVAFKKYLWALPSSDKSLMVPLMTMMFIFGSVHHTIYHMQSWLIIGLFWGVCVRNQETAAGSVARVAHSSGTNECGRGYV